MKKIIDFLDKWAVRITFPLFLILFFKTCSTNGKIEKLEKNLTEKNKKLDYVIKSETISREDLKIEGLKVEKRMIQSTDRKILDVNRQSEIDKEVQILENK